MSDENGINVSEAGIGHAITLTLNDTLNLIINDYYTADLDNYRKGTVRYPFENLSAGKYTIRIKVWDTYTNSSEITFGFQVGLPTGIKVNSLTVFPNPFDQDLSFELNQNRADDDVEIIFSLLLNSGQLLGSYRWQYYNSEPVIKQKIPSIRPGGFTLGTSSYLYTLKNPVVKRQFSGYPLRETAAFTLVNNKSCNFIIVLNIFHCIFDPLKEVDKHQLPIANPINMRLFLLSVSSLFLLSTSSLLAQVDTTRRIPSSPLSFLTFAPDARSAGMGEAGVALSADANATYWNAAKLPYATKGFWRFSFLHTLAGQYN